MSRHILNMLASVALLLSIGDALAFYNPSTGRWLSRDPIEERGGVNCYGCVGNDPIRRYDFLGLTIPGMCGAAYPNWCPCKCVSVVVTFSPGNDNFEWRWLPNPNGGQRFGNDMTVVWKVEGPASRCKFSQLESADFYFFNYLNLSAKTRHASWSDHTVVDSHGQSCWGERSYTDSVGALGLGFTSPADNGNWEVRVVTPPKITVVCESSDGTKKSQELSVPPPPNPGNVPP